MKTKDEEIRREIRVYREKIKDRYEDWKIIKMTARDKARLGEEIIDEIEAILDDKLLSG